MLTARVIVFGRSEPGGRVSNGLTYAGCRRVHLIQMSLATRVSFSAVFSIEMTILDRSFCHFGRPIGAGHTFLVAMIVDARTGRLPIRWHHSYMSFLKIGCGCPALEKRIFLGDSDDGVRRMKSCIFHVEVAVRDGREVWTQSSMPVVRLPSFCFGHEAVLRFSLMVRKYGLVNFRPCKYRLLKP